MEFCGEGTIWDVAKQGLTIDMIRKYTYEVTVGLDELHRQSIVHRDIKGCVCISPVAYEVPKTAKEHICDTYAICLMPSQSNFYH